MKENIVEYLKEYKTLGDYVELKSGKIYNLGFEVDVFVDKNYTTSDVVKSVINKISEYMSVQNHDMGEDIFIGDLEKEVNMIDGVLSLIDLRVYSIYSKAQGNHSSDICSLPKYSDEKFTSADGSDSFMIDLSATDHLLYSDHDSMYEIYDVNNDIKVRCKLK